MSGILIFSSSRKYFLQPDIMAQLPVRSVAGDVGLTVCGSNCTRVVLVFTPQTSCQQLNTSIKLTNLRNGKKEKNCLIDLQHLAPGE